MVDLAIGVLAKKTIRKQMSSEMNISITVRDGRLHCLAVNGSVALNTGDGIVNHQVNPVLYDLSSYDWHRAFQFIEMASQQFVDEVAIEQARRQVQDCIKRESEPAENPASVKRMKTV